MVGNCCKMYIKFKFVIFIFLLLPSIILSSNARQRGRPGHVAQNEESNESSSYPDQLALSTTYRQRGLIRPRNSESDKFNQRQHFQPNESSEEASSEDPRSVFFTENLANTKSAQEYVEKAVELHGKYGGMLNSSPKTTSKPVTNHKNNNLISSSSTPALKYEVYEGNVEGQTENPMQFFNKDAVTRSSYDTYDFDDDDEYNKPSTSQRPYIAPFGSINYRQHHEDSGYHAQQQQQQQQQNFAPKDNIAGSTTAIPKEEIFQKIEESVIKYMQNLEASGKLPITAPAAPQQQPQKIYYKIHHPALSPEKGYINDVKQNENILTQSETGLRIPHPTPSTSVKILLKDESVFPSGNFNSQQHDVVPDNVEVIYKIKTRPHQGPEPENYKNVAFHPSPSPSPSPAPSPKPNGPSYDHPAFRQFDGFDVGHIFPEEQRPKKAKLYFNTETYRDINSLPYKPEKILFRPENKEHGEQRRPAPEYKTFQPNPHHQPHHPAMPYAPIMEHQEHQDNQKPDDGYPVMNPYRLMLQHNKESEDNTGLPSQPGNWQPYLPNKNTGVFQYDSYNPKYNNNPEGFGYQHNYKAPRQPKRGKRGQNHSKKPGKNSPNNKNPEANTALRPPPQNPPKNRRK